MRFRPAALRFSSLLLMALRDASHSSPPAHMQRMRALVWKQRELYRFGCLLLFLLFGFLAGSAAQRCISALQRLRVAADIPFCASWFMDSVCNIHYLVAARKLLYASRSNTWFTLRTASLLPQKTFHTPVSFIFRTLRLRLRFCRAARCCCVERVAGCCGGCSGVGLAFVGWHGFAVLFSATVFAFLPLRARHFYAFIRRSLPFFICYTRSRLCVRLDLRASSVLIGVPLFLRAQRHGLSAILAFSRVGMRPAAAIAALFTSLSTCVSTVAVYGCCCLPRHYTPHCTQPRLDGSSHLCMRLPFLLLPMPVACLFLFVVAFLPTFPSLAFVYALPVPLPPAPCSIPALPSALR